MTPFVGKLPPQLGSDARRRFCLPYLRKGQERQILLWHGVLFTSRGNFDLEGPVTVQTDGNKLVCEWRSNFLTGATELNQFAVVAGAIVVCDDAMIPQLLEMESGDQLKLSWSLYCKITGT